MTDSEKKQIASFAYGNLRLSGVNCTREDVERVVEEMNLQDIPHPDTERMDKLERLLKRGNWTHVCIESDNYHGTGIQGCGEDYEPEHRSNSDVQVRHTLRELVDSIKEEQ